MSVNLPFNDGFNNGEWERMSGLSEPGEVEPEVEPEVESPEVSANVESTLVVQPGGTVTNLSPFGLFEGSVIHSIRAKIKSEAQVESLAGIDVTTFDRVRLVGEYTVVGVKHMVDRDGNLVREVELKAANLEVAPWDPSDLTDDGILRVRPRRS